MKELLIATGNPAKKKMYFEMLKNEDIKLIFLDDFVNVPPAPDENKDTIEQNSLLKAKYYFDHFGIPCIGDDAGLSIDDLNGEPGVKARRWGGILPDDISDEDWITFFHEKTKDIKNEPFNGSFPYSRCLYMGVDNYFFHCGERKVKIFHSQQGKYRKGWPLSSFLMDDGDEKYLENRGQKEFLEFIRDKFL